MHGRTVLGALALVGLIGATTARSAPPVLTKDNDGAALCAEAKTALALRPAREPFSAASTNIDIRYYHLDLTFPMVTVDCFRGGAHRGHRRGFSLSTLVLDLQNTMTVTAVKLAERHAVHVHTSGRRAQHHVAVAGSAGWRCGR